jgi:hypothetical protein
MEQKPMTNAEHILSWCENSQPHWKRLRAMRPGHYTTVREHAYAAFVLASDTAKAMICAGDLSRMELQSADILGAAVLMIEAQQVPA